MSLKPTPYGTLEHWASLISSGDRAALARAITLVESRKKSHRALAAELIQLLLPKTGQSLRVGITGVPGVGKSTLIDVFARHAIANGHKVAVLAVDPSSVKTGGSILGDKTRMGKLSRMNEAYIRPSPSAGTLGGIAAKTRESMLLCEAAGFDRIIVETVGTGQSEVKVADMVDCFIALMLPGAGDDLQGMKKGLLEIADIIAINKADGDVKHLAMKAADQYKAALSLFQGHDTTWQTPGSDTIRIGR
jgi:LAO/AO transport system kinase